MEEFEKLLEAYIGAHDEWMVAGVVSVGAARKVNEARAAVLACVHTMRGDA